MTTISIPRPSRLRMFAKSALDSFRARSKPVSKNLADHSFTIAGFGFISAASFVHSVFSGLLITGILCLVFEWKVSD